MGFYVAAAILEPTAARWHRHNIDVHAPCHLASSLLAAGSDRVLTYEGSIISPGNKTIPFAGLCPLVVVLCRAEPFNGKKAQKSTQNFATQKTSYQPPTDRLRGLRDHRGRLVSG